MIYPKEFMNDIMEKIKQMKQQTLCLKSHKCKDGKRKVTYNIQNTIQNEV